MQPSSSILNQFQNMLSPLVRKIWENKVQVEKYLSHPVRKTPNGHFYFISRGIQSQSLNFCFVFTGKLKLKNMGILIFRAFHYTKQMMKSNC